MFGEMELSSFVHFCTEEAFQFHGLSAFLLYYDAVHFLAVEFFHFRVLSEQVHELLFIQIVNDRHFSGRHIHERSFIDEEFPHPDKRPFWHFLSINHLLIANYDMAQLRKVQSLMADLIVPIQQFTLVYRLSPDYLCQIFLELIFFSFAGYYLLKKEEPDDEVLFVPVVELLPKGAGYQSLQFGVQPMCLNSWCEGLFQKIGIILVIFLTYNFYLPQLLQIYQVLGLHILLVYLVHQPDYFVSKVPPDNRHCYI